MAAAAAAAAALLLAYCYCYIYKSLPLFSTGMVGNRLPAAAPSAAVLGGRNSRRQVRAMLTLAAEAGAYSVGVSIARGGLSGFTVYYLGDLAGAGGVKAAPPRASHTMRVPSVLCAGPDTSMVRALRAAADCGALPSLYDEKEQVFVRFLL